MRRSLILTGLLASALASGSLEAQRMVDRFGYSLAPRVQVWFTGGSSAQFGYPMQVQFRADDDAYVIVGRVDSDGRLSILYPYNRSQRAFVRGEVTTIVRDPRLRSDASFYVSDRMRGYVFAIASYTPMDLSTFDARDYNRSGGFSAFTRVNREVAREPDEYVSRVAAELFWGTNADYDYDVAYYSPSFGGMTYLASTLSYCDRAFFRRLSLQYPWYSYDDYVMSPYDQVCRDFMLGMQCMSAYWMFVPGACGHYLNRETVIATIPIVPREDTAGVNDGIIRTGLWRPDTVSGTPYTGGDDRAERIATIPNVQKERTGGGSEFDGIYSLPDRVKKKLVAGDDSPIEVIRGGTRDAGGGRTFRDVRRADGTPMPAGKGVKETRFADGSPIRYAPPARTEPTTYSPISASKAPKRSGPLYAGPASTGNGNGSTRRTVADGAAPRPAATSAPASSSPTFSQAASTGEKSKPPR